MSFDKNNFEYKSNEKKKDTNLIPILPDDIEEEPPDHYFLIYIIFFLQGIGLLLPWNFFITANEYFSFKFSGNHFIQQNFEKAFSLGSMLPALISLTVNIFLTRKLSRTCRISSCLSVMFTMFFITTIFVKIDTTKWTQSFFGVTIFCIVFIHLASGIYEGTLFGLAGLTGSKYTQALMAGQGVAGIFAATTDLIFKLAYPNPVDKSLSAFGYFVTASVVILFTAITYPVLFKLPKIKFLLNKSDLKRKNNVKQSEYSANILKKKIPYYAIFKQIMPLGFSVSAVFCVTLSLFPAVVSKIVSTNKSNSSRFANDLFSSLVCFFIFNCGNLAGRIASGFYQIVNEKGPWLPLLCFSRILFIPLFLMCHFKNGSILLYVFKYDYWPVIINCLFAFSHGYLGSLCMMFGPKLVSAKYSETAGTIMSCFLTTGLTAGALLSFAYNV
ncbi:equilibrative nucleoside transporter 1 [Hydra vulgaris]|uniref:equilibrative nucleoside transporter 1 n=1 Tax=Hydra vulgaris TaxID=6087 RepID=UPI000192481F|nr:equilibrative nucleoside transporter 1 [Hydra vulgaris]